MIGVYIWIPFVGTFLGAACVLFMTAAGAEIPAGICIRSHGGSVGMVAIDSVFGIVRRNGKVVIYSGSSWICPWNCIFADFG